MSNTKSCLKPLPVVLKMLDTAAHIIRNSPTSDNETMNTVESVAILLDTFKQRLNEIEGMDYVRSSSFQRDKDAWRVLCQVTRHDQD